MAPAKDYKDRVTGRNVAAVTTGQIYWGAVPFVLIQIIMVGLIIAFPGIVTRDTNKAAEGNIDLLQQQIDSGRKDEAKPEPQMPGAEPKKDEPEDPMEAIRRANEQDKQKK